MMKLPEKFQMRHKLYGGFTHVVKVEGGSVKVKWARGYADSTGFIPNSVLTLSEAEYYVQNGLWVVVDEKKVEQGLPDEFYFHCFEVSSIIYRATRQANNKFDVTWDGKLQYTPLYYTEEHLVSRFKSGDWEMYKSMPLTPEQLRSNADVREQISALDHSIRLAYQDIEHKDKLIKSYLARQGELSSKIVKES